MSDDTSTVEKPAEGAQSAPAGMPSALPEAEIESLRRGLAGHVRMAPHPYLQVGGRVRVRSGPMAGLEGILRRRKEGLRLVVSIEMLARAVAVEVDEADVDRT